MWNLWVWCGRNTNDKEIYLFTPAHLIPSAVTSMQTISRTIKQSIWVIIEQGKMSFLEQLPRILRFLSGVKDVG